MTCYFNVCSKAGVVWYGMVGLNVDLYSAITVVKVDRRIRWHYTTTILRLRIDALTHELSKL